MNMANISYVDSLWSRWRKTEVQVVQGGLVDLEDPEKHQQYWLNCANGSNTCTGSEANGTNWGHSRDNHIQLHPLNLPSLLWRRSALVDPKKTQFDLKYEHVEYELKALRTSYGSADLLAPIQTDTIKI